MQQPSMLAILVGLFLIALYLYIAVMIVISAVVAGLAVAKWAAEKTRRL
jgi:hypothetical protein